MARTADLDPNLNAFLDMIAVAEGTAGIGDDGYNVLFGATKERPKLFVGYSDHPRVLTTFRRLDGTTGKSSAAGRYQLLERWFDAYKRILKLSDISPESQDRIAIQQIREQRALSLVLDGRLIEAVEKCRNIWASFPGAGYRQRERSMVRLRAAYLAAGGRLV